jgi:hypothetical protein
VRRFALVFFVAALSISASGVIDLILPEPCSIEEAGLLQDDGSCAATCVRCNCCARSIEVVAASLVSVQIPIVSKTTPAFASVPIGTPSEILHVPKL